jgi:hypothetical protein
MSEPKRYTISGLHPHIYENKDGFMVYYEDYASLKAEVERLRKAGTEMGKYLPDTDEANRAYIDFEAGGRS